MVLLEEQEQYDIEMPQPQPPPPRSKLRKRNVEVFDSGGAVIAGMSLSYIALHAAFPLTTFAGFWQYGALQWDEFYQLLRTFVVTSTDWAIFQYEPTHEQRGTPCPPGTGIVQEGSYILLSTSE